MSADTQSIRIQTLANARLLLAPPPRKDSLTPNPASQTTLISPQPRGDIDVVVFGAGNEFTAAVMVGLVPAIEGELSPTSDGALRKLFAATCELLLKYIP